jgi:hypothetical protein
MSLRAAARHQLDPLLGHSPLVMLSAVVLASATGMVVVMSVVFAVRRLAGYWTQPLPVSALLLVGLLLVGLISVLRFGWWALGHLDGAGPTALHSGVWWAACSLALGCTGVALSISGTGLGALVSFWLLLLVSDAGAWYWRFRRQPSPAGPGHPERGHTERGHTERGQAAGPLVESGEHELELDEGSLLPPEVSQQITRARPHQGLETVSGLLRGDFLPGQRSASLHVAFCPIFAERPVVEVMQTAGPSCHIKAADIQAHGVRFDVRLTSGGESSESVLIYFEARAAAGDESSR